MTVAPPARATGSIRSSAPPLNVTEMSPAALREAIAALGEPAYRAAQIERWVFARGARDFESMSDLPRALRDRLVAEGFTVGRVTVGRVAESIDSTRKLSIRLADGGVVETVLIPMGEGRFSQCLSSQLGCALDCKFCYTGTLGLSRNLTPGEIVDQVIVARAALPEGSRVTHLVYMGMGEPLHNFDAVMESIGRICDPAGLGYSHRKVTVSTSGLVPQIERLGRTAPVNLAVSLNASRDEIRDRIMPINKRYDIATLISALERYPLPARRKLTVEYVLLGGLNDDLVDARALVRILGRLRGRVRINLIPWNPFAGPGFERPDEGRVADFHRHLDERGFTVTVRTTKGLDIDAACGQLGARPQAA